MKKKVRIYRAPDGQGAIINKTSKFLKKAQQGGVPDPSQMGYPGAEQQQAQPSEDQVAQSIVVDISNGRPKEETVMRLVTSLGQDPLSASQYYDQIYTALEAQQNEAEEEADEDSEDTPIKEEIEQNQVQEIEEGFYGDDTNNDMANEIAAEDDEDYADDDQIASDIIMQFGGVSPVIVPIRQDGGEAYPIQFPGVDAYLPPNMQEILSGQTDVLTGQAWSPVTESQAGVAPDEEVDNSYRTGGQYKKDKRVYVNSMMKLAKKQMGGEDMSKKGDTDFRGEDVRKERLNSFLGTVKNEAQLAKVKEQAEQQFDQMMQQQQMQQQFAQNGAQINSSVQGMDRDPGFVINPKTGKPWSKSEWDNLGVISGCFGGNCLPDESETGILPGQSDIIGIPKGKAKSGTPPYIAGYPVPNIYGNQIPMRRGLFGRPRMPRGVGFGYGIPISKIDVRRTGIFGRPKEYSIEFGASPMPGMPGSGAGFYGYGQTIKKGKSKGRIITEEVSKTVNNESIKDVASDTPNSTATNKPSLEEMRKAAAAAGYDPWNSTTANTSVNTETTAQNIKNNSATSNKRKPVDVNSEKDDAVKNNSNTKRYLEDAASSVINFTEDLLASTVKRDKWGRPQGSKWYGFDPKTKKFTKGVKATQIDPSKRIPVSDKRYWHLTPDERQINDTQDIRTGKFFETFKKQEGGAQYYNPFGGFVDSDNPDLYKFIYGGNDPYFTQEDLDDVYSKDTSDPYFAMGGLTTYQNKGEVKEDDYDKYQREKAEKEALDEYNSFMNRGEGDAKKMVAYKANANDAIYNKILGQTRKKYNIADPNEQPKSENTTTTTKKKTTTTDYEDYNPYGNVGYNDFNVFGNLFPANIASYQGTWGKVKRGPYDPRTGMAIPGMGFGPNTQISSIDVKRSGMFGRPKKYTINYSNQQMDPRKQNLITVPGQEASSSTTTPGSQGYSGQDPATQKQGNRFSNTKGLKAGTRAKVAMKELFNRYNDEEEVPETNVDVDQSPKRKTPELIKMDIKRPGLVSPSENLVRAKYEESVRKAGSRADQNRPIGNPAYEERNRRISPSKEQLEKLYNRDVFQNGGDLKRFVGGVSRFQPGGYVNQTPVVFTDNPAHVGMSNVDMISLNEGIPDLKPSSFWQDQASFNEEVPVNTQKQPEQIKTDPTQVSSDQAKKAYQATPGDFSIDVKNKNMYEIDPEAAINVANAGIRGVTGMIDRMRNKKREAKMYENLTADNLYASDPSRDRGDYDANTGLYRPDSQGATHTSRSKKYGGDSNYSEGDVIDMSEEELAEFLANGGEVEYLNY